ncbi:25S rRNA (uracil2843-N3)-methyltransferase [Aspergillus fijiensis CBS 313.89]|uniref:25S rRNA (Uridine(2843)-N(3))-methyltransferase n=1 Tax=Aspergillus fijiensis CBS 313.89 TaxID=1448319 RepID=A0A8G1RGQ0_9EURO|nr:uncharacterized protein BO72DRAFT_437430 [Aspergillus fijiensis CBS 313.89]RAK73537.1 hypothetical protein BO72DRAFT_437430 [Aspergillus fijiensis CBS 313.89]
MGPSKKAAKSSSQSQSRGGSRNEPKKSSRGTTTIRGKHQHRPHNHGAESAAANQIDLSATIPLTLQQLLLNVFKAALLTHRVPSSISSSSSRSEKRDGDGEGEGEGDEAEQQQQQQPQLDIKGLIQTIKSHLYNRDFDSAFTDADEELLRAYALRWSSSRALGYAGIFRALLGVLLKREGRFAGATTSAVDGDDAEEGEEGVSGHVVCIGGGAGAEIVALAAAWRDWSDVFGDGRMRKRRQLAARTLAAAVDDLSLHETNGPEAQATATVEDSSTPDGRQQQQQQHQQRHRLSVTAIDIADWSPIVDRLVSTIRSPAVAGSDAHPAPLYRDAGLSIGPDAQNDSARTSSSSFQVGFQKLDVLSASEKELRRLVQPDTASGPVLVTLMFTLNELFSTSMAKATGFLLRLTDMLRPGAVLLVVDSPGSYSTLKLGKNSAGGSGESTSSSTSERQYPMKFLLDHALLSVAAGKWDRLFSQDSRWWRRDAARLRYGVGDAAGLEDMRFQVHIYRRLAD